MIINPYIFAGDLSRPLDSLSAAAAFSIRKLRNAYGGSCIRIRRSSDSTEMNIGFVSGALDTAAISTFCGAGDGFIVTWYDQSGNSKNYSQGTTANQPKIYESGSLLVDANGKARIKFDGTNDLLACTDTAFEINQPLTSTHVAQSITGNKIPFGSSSYGSFFAQSGGSTSFGLYAGIIASITMNPQNHHLLSVVWNGTSSLSKVDDATEVSRSLGTNGTGVNQTIGAGGGSPTTYCWNGYIQEFILFASGLSAGTLDSLHSDIVGYYQL